MWEWHVFWKIWIKLDLHTEGFMHMSAAAADIVGKSAGRAAEVPRWELRGNNQRHGRSIDRRAVASSIHMRLLTAYGGR